MESLQQALYYHFASKCVVVIVYADNGLQSSKENVRWAQLPENSKGRVFFRQGNPFSVGEMKWLSKTCISVCIYHSQSVLMLSKFKEGGEACTISINLSLHTAL